MSEPPGAPVLRVAMWSGPRNISTAMMRAWENRPDTVVVDEPFYAAYLAATRLDHPGRDEVLRAQPQDPAAVVAGLLAPVPDGVRVHYAKHMTHHLDAVPDLDWVGRCRNVLLIRDPAEVVASYVRSREACAPRDIGLLQQERLLAVLEQLGQPDPPVLDAADVLREPETYLRWVCDWLGIPFSERMLAWPAGPRDSDGVWAPHWYDAVLASTGFAPYRERQVHLDPRGAAVAAACRPAYDRLRERRLRLAG
ncbi:HAD family hydrolase [Aquipuribacter sp. SD81]|uniref:sulfotransferase-like domain-containing protein n=1 Tax=Aquipuribacter sp. SD81 TaxID=3127703 RepID=UPI00301B5351